MVFYMFWTKIEQKGMTFDHDFGYSFPSLKKKEEEKDNE